MQLVTPRVVATAVMMLTMICRMVFQVSFFIGIRFKVSTGKVRAKTAGGQKSGRR